jgi:hypothetical protein
VDQTFHYAADLKLAPFWAPFGVRPSRDGVTLTDDALTARFGFLHVETPITNVVGAHVTGGYRWWTAAGARLSFADDGLTFGTNAERGVCIHFAAPVRSRLRPAGHSALTVTVAEPEALVAAIEARCDPDHAAARDAGE